MNRETKLGIGLCLTLTLLACCVVAMAMIAGGGLWLVARTVDTTAAPTLIARSTPRPSHTPTPFATLVRTPPPSPLPGEPETLTTIQNAEVPPRDLRALAERLTLADNIPATVSALPADHPVGTVLEFNVHNTDTNESFTVSARLVYRTENAYFFAEEGVTVDERDVRALVDDFQNNIYPTNRAFFGSEWNPGVDGDPRLYILFARGLGFGTLGYYSSEDEYSRLTNATSNEKEIFYINADITRPDDPDLPAVLAHEFQHMIHWNQDINEETWLNEGASMLAELLNGHTAPRGYALDFVSNPDLQLNAWTDGDTIPHYGAGFMFLTYFLDRFGEDAAKALIAEQRNGLDAVEAVLAARNLIHVDTGHALTAADVFADWVVANYLNDPTLADGRFGYTLMDDPPTASATDEFRRCPVETQDATVTQFGTDYYRFECRGTYTLTFSGSQQVRVMPTAPHSGRYAFWSHRNDESATSLTRAFDFSNLSQVTFTYWTYWDIEDEYDFAYLEVSTDGGETWRIVRTPSGTDANDTGTNLGWGYTSHSGSGSEAEWIQEQVDLSEYAGQNVLIRFEYVTDTALNFPGLLLDDIAIPELNYHEDFEGGAGGWEAQGFVRIDNLLPQRYMVQLIRQGGSTTVERLTLDAANQARVTLEMNAGETITLVVSGLTPFTTEIAPYQFALEE